MNARGLVLTVSVAGEGGNDRVKGEGKKFGRRFGTGASDNLNLFEYVSTFGLCQNMDKREEGANLVMKNCVRATLCEVDRFWTTLVFCAREKRTVGVRGHRKKGEGSRLGV
jgi:hypothetical protein